MRSPLTLADTRLNPSELRLGTFQPEMADTPLPRFLEVLHALHSAAPQQVTCVVLPLAREASQLLAVFASLTRLREHFGDLVTEYARTQFKQGELVRVLPSKLVYSFDGYFEAKHGNLFRLRILGKRDSEVRACDAGEILRLQRTDRATPRGRANSDLGRIELTPLDRLLGIRTFGNGSVLRCEVLLQSSRSAFDELLSNIAVPVNGVAPVTLASVLPWGIVGEDGSLGRNDDSDGAPLCAVTSNSERLRLAGAFTMRPASQVSGATLPKP